MGENARKKENCWRTDARQEGEAGKQKEGKYSLYAILFVISLRFFFLTFSLFFFLLLVFLLLVVPVHLLLGLLVILRAQPIKTQTIKLTSKTVCPADIKCWINKYVHWLRKLKFPYNSLNEPLCLVINFSVNKAWRKKKKEKPPHNPGLTSLYLGFPSKKNFILSYKVP